MKIRNLFLKTNPKIDKRIQQLERTLNSLLILRILPLRLEIQETAERGNGRCFWRNFFWRVPIVYRHVLEHYSWEKALHIIFHEIWHALDLFTLSYSKREQNADKFAEKIIKKLHQGLLEPSFCFP